MFILITRSKKGDACIYFSEFRKNEQNKVLTAVYIIIINKHRPVYFGPD